jgi:mannose-1-phosphate guanylyltransferase
MDPMASTLWATVLAGGSGLRLATVTNGVPKQFWGFAHGGTLLEATLDRLAPLVPATRTTIVVDRTHEPYIRELSHVNPACRVLYQPCNRGTAAGILFGILPALSSARDRVVVLTPSDHGVLDTETFRASIKEAVVRVLCGRQPLVLFGAEPSDVDDDYGWITPDLSDRSPSAHVVQRVMGFVEKPPPEVAATLLASGAVWNTMVVVTRAAHLLDLYRRHLPELAAIFDRALGVSSRARPAFLQDAYRDVPDADFCRDLLMAADDLWVHVWPSALGWSDLGTPERLRAWLAQATRTAPVRHPRMPRLRAGVSIQTESA